jgi:hypothetical protein
VEEPRCLPCATAHGIFWTRAQIIERMREWADIYGEPPAVPDWCPSVAARNGDPDRVRRFREAKGQWPAHTTVFEVFGPSGWNAAIEAAGFAPRRSGGFAENAARRRSERAKAAA